MSEVAFAPKAGVVADQLGTVFVDDGPDLNIREAVFSDGETRIDRTRPAPEGYLVTSDPGVIRKLDEYVHLKRVALSEVEDAAKTPSDKADKKAASPKKDAKE
jgi:hypothetical protein